MDIKMNPNAVNQFPKGSDIYVEGEPVFSVAMIIKGRVLIHSEGVRIIMSPGSFLGINDLYLGKFQNTYTAYDDLLIYAYPVNSIEELETVLSVNKDYHGFMVASHCKIIYELDQICQGLMKHGSELYQFLKDTYQQYLVISDRRGFRIKKTDRFNTLTLIDSDLELLTDRVNYYIECRNLPIDIVKQFYSYGNLITLYQIEDQIDVVNEQIEAIKDMTGIYVSLAKCLMDDTDTCLFQLIADLSSETVRTSGNSNELIDVMDNIIEEINKVELFSEKTLGKKLKVNRKRMEEVYHLLLTGDKGKDSENEAAVKHTKEDIKQVMDECRDSFNKILIYAGIEGERAEGMRSAMLDFVNMTDKTSSEDSARSIRRHLTDNHYELYKEVFIKAYQDNNLPKPVKLFLRFGFADERLLTKEQLVSLFYLPDEDLSQGQCAVYDIRSWLTMIYEGKKEPSKNEFDLEYPEMLASLKKQGKLTDKEVTQWAADKEKKLEYEIQNMFRCNNRTTSGQITIFTPVLHKDLLSDDFERIYITAAKVNETVKEIMKLDYSVFDREVLYANKEKKIVKEYIIRRVYADIILMPNVGSNGVMWQEISGKRRDSAGRFLLPIFTEINIDTLLIRIFGKFRWELCRTIEGTAWNDIAQKSLTSEYSDYLQFYRKNKDLSEEKKEKLKQQIQKGRNSSREIFVIDYEQWISYESLGAIKLNKLVREILATYCPFSKEIREQLKLQPLFEEAMARYNRDKLKKIREIEGRYRLLQKDQIEITQELIDTLDYYKEM